MEYTEQPVQILIVDDTPDILKLLAQILESKGFQVLQAPNGKVALEIAVRAEPNLILLDVKMPEMDGYETCRQLKQMEALQEIPVIFLSGLDEPFDKMEAFRLGGVDYITKPFQKEELLARVQTHLRLRELTEHLEQQVQERTQELQQEIAEHRRAQQALADSEERLNLALEATNAGIWDYHLENDQMYFSPRWFTMLGYEPDEFPHTYETWLKLLHPDDRVQVEQEVEKFLGNREEYYSTEFRMQTKGAEWRWIQAMGKVVARDTTGNIARMIGTHTDITERKQAEEDLREREDMIRALIETSKDWIWSIDVQGIHTYCNPAVEAILGYRPDELVGKPSLDLIHAEDRVQIEASLAEWLKEERGWNNQLIRWRHKDGGYHYLESNAVPILDPAGDLIGFRGVDRDITERKLAEEALQRYTDRLEILHQIDQAILAAQSAEAIAQAAMAHIRQLIPCQRAGVTLFDFGTNEAIMLAVDADVETGFKESTRFSLEPFANELKLWRQGQVVTWGEPHLRGEDIQALFTAQGLGSTVSVPLMTQGELIGTLNLSYEAAKPRVFTQEHEAIARQIAAQLAIAIRQSRLQEQLQQYTEGLEHLIADRTRELSVLYEVTAIANEERDLKTILARSLEKILAALSSNVGIIHLLDDPDSLGAENRLRLVVQQGLPVALIPQIESMPADKGLGGYVIEHSEPLIVADVASDPRAPEISFVGDPYMYMGMPMRASGRVMGVLSILREETYPHFNVEEITLLTSIADQMGVVVESARLRQQAEQAVVMEERARLARELHDSVTQLLYSMNLFAKSGQNAHHLGNQDELEYCLNELGENAQQALKEMRMLVYELRPPILEQDGLVGALQNRLDTVEGRVGIKTQLLTGTTIEMPPQIEGELYHIALEALNNSLKHAQATEVTVKIERTEDQVNLEIIDNGLGFDPETTKDTGGFGLSSMRERAEKLGGIMTLTSRPERGTTVCLTINL